MPQAKEAKAIGMKCPRRRGMDGTQAQRRKLGMDGGQEEEPKPGKVEKVMIMAKASEERLAPSRKRLVVT